MAKPLTAWKNLGRLGSVAAQTVLEHHQRAMANTDLRRQRPGT
jgi:hypothetical protein